MWGVPLGWLEWAINDWSGRPGANDRGYMQNAQYGVEECGPELRAPIPAVTFSSVTLAKRFPL